jgi:hypothetical protein
MISNYRLFNSRQGCKSGIFLVKKYHICNIIEFYRGKICLVKKDHPQSNRNNNASFFLERKSYL